MFRALTVRCAEIMIELIEGGHKVTTRKYANLYGQRPGTLMWKVFGIAIAFAGLFAMNSGIAQASTIPFSLTVTGGVVTNGQPSPSNLVLMETFTGSGVVAPFGTGTYSDMGTITFDFFPSGFGVMSATSNFVFSFNAGANTFFGTSVDTFSAPDAFGSQANTGVLTIIGGTGKFSGASGFANAMGLSDPSPTAPIVFSGTGLIAAPVLVTVPEPRALTLLGIAMILLAGAAGMQRRIRSSSSV